MDFLLYYLPWKTIKLILLFTWFLSITYKYFRGAEINVQDINGCSLAHLAAFNNNLFILKILRNVFKFNIFEKDKKDKTPLMRAEE